MNSEQRKRVAARFARMWKRRIRAEKGDEYRRENLHQIDEQLTPGVSKRTAMLIAVVVLAGVLVVLLLRR